jgi:hypothetical protein
VRGTRENQGAGNGRETQPNTTGFKDGGKDPTKEIGKGMKTNPHIDSLEGSTAPCNTSDI